MERKIGPLQPDHSLVTDETICRACHQPFRAGEFLALIPLGPGDDPEAQARARAGRPYNAIALPIHWACATGEV